MSKAAPTPYLHAGLTQSILAAAIRVQDALGPGLLEKPYRLCLAQALRQAGHRVILEVSLAIAYEGLVVPDAYRLDLLVDDTVIVEAKAVEALDPMHRAQLLTYLRLAGKEVGLLLNFWARPLKDRGIQRLVLTGPGR
jgi:GxxExxY protein